MEYHKMRFKDASIVVYKKDYIVAVLPANRLANSIYSHQGLTYGGLIFLPFTRLKEKAEILKLVLNYLADLGIEDLYIKTLPNCYKGMPDDSMSYILNNIGIIESQNLFSLCDLENFTVSSSRQEGHKRALSHKLILEETDDFSGFWNSILIPNLQAKHQAKPVHSLEEISKLKQLFPKNIRQFNVFNGDDLVAGATIFETDYVAHLQYISGNSDKNTLGSLDFLITVLMRDVFKTKRYFDFGTSHKPNGSINEGLHFWKEGFGTFGEIQNIFKVRTKSYKDINDLF